MQFGLAKIGCHEPFDRKWPNNNARIEKYDSWPWKLPFKEHRCILPLSEFREPGYWGDTAGTEVYFKAADGEYLGVAGLYNVWKITGAEKFYSMTFLMRPACKFVEIGHQLAWRCRSRLRRQSPAEPSPNQCVAHQLCCNPQCGAGPRQVKAISKISITKRANGRQRR